MTSAISASFAKRAWIWRYGTTDVSAGHPPAAGLRAEDHHQQEFLLVLPDRLGFLQFRPRQRHSRRRQRLGRRARWWDICWGCATSIRSDTACSSSGSWTRAETRCRISTSTSARTAAQKIIEYVRNKYGHVAQIITFGTLAARAACKDVGRVLGVPLAETDKITKLIPGTPGMTLDKALDQSPELAEAVQGRSAGQADHRHRQAARRPVPQRGHARRRRGHRGSAAGKFRPALQDSDDEHPHAV